MAIRLRRVVGLEGRANDVVVAPPKRPPRPASPSEPAAHADPAPLDTLVFFGGDVQDYPESMAAHRDNRNYLKWNLESTARRLAKGFPHRLVLVVRPARIEYKSFSCYDNFVPSNNAGVPDHTPTHAALLHLDKLVQGVWARLRAMPAAELRAALCPPGPAHPDTDQHEPEDLQNATVSKPDAPSALPGAGPGPGPGPAAGRSNGATHCPSETDEACDFTTTAPAPAPASAPTTQPESESPDSDADSDADAEAECDGERDPLWWLSVGDGGGSGRGRGGRLALAGFSKGCVVLNQLIYEFHYTKTLTPGDKHMMRFIERIDEMYWLDGGHAGGKNTWITSRSLLETLSRLEVRVWVHVSPYQVSDGGRPWIGREEHAFTHLLAKLGARVQRYLHEEPGAAHNLLMHFSVLDKFVRVQAAAPAPLAPASAPGPLADTASALTDSSDDET